VALETLVQTGLKDPIARMEALRQERLASFKRTRLALYAAAFVVFVISLMVTGPLGCCLGPFFGVFIVWGGSEHYKKRLFAGDVRDQFKRDIIAPLVEFAVPSATYDPNGRVSKSEFAASGIFQVQPSSLSGDDLVVGRLGDTDFEFSELHAEYKVQSGDSTDTRTAFKGLFFSADFHKHFEGYTIVRPRRPKVLKTNFSRASRAEKMSTNWAASEHLMAAPWRAEHSWKGSLQEVELEDPEFAERFEVYSTNQVEARYILSTSMMQRLIGFHGKATRARDEMAARLASNRRFFQVVGQKDMESGRVYISFAGTKVYIAMGHYRDLFELDPETPVAEGLEEYLEELEFALGTVEDLNLNTRIWSKAPPAEPA
jgi:hypothetical protein